MNKIKRIGVLTSGGDCQSLNATMRGVAKSLYKMYDNEIEIEVANSLMNRMIGDAALPAEERLTYAYPEIVTPADTLVASGIIGPVSLLYRGKEGQ